jgi:hypothetical protein
VIKLTGDFGNEPDTTLISGRGLLRLPAAKLLSGIFRLLQQYRHKREVPMRTANVG